MLNANCRMYQINLNYLRGDWELEFENNHWKTIKFGLQLNTIHENIREFLSGIELLRALQSKSKNFLYLFH
jgi:hypothetical protein